MIHIQANMAFWNWLPEQGVWGHCFLPDSYTLSLRPFLEKANQKCEPEASLDGPEASCHHWFTFNSQLKKVPVIQLHHWRPVQHNWISVQREEKRALWWSPSTQILSLAWPRHHGKKLLSFPCIFLMKSSYFFFFQDRNSGRLSPEASYSELESFLWCFFRFCYYILFFPASAPNHKPKYE